MIQKTTVKYIYIYALALFLLSAIVGVLMRWNFVYPSSFINYKNFLQGHSHVAFLGWGYLAIISAIIHIFIPQQKRLNKIYSYSILVGLVTSALMLFSFPLAGYKAFSIVLLSVFGISSYVLLIRVLKDLEKTSVANKLVKYGIYYYLLSSLATWFLVAVIITQGKSILYHNTIYFYLHFLYNGFFVFGLFGLLFKVFENHQILISEKYQNKFFVFLNIACIPAYSLSILWSNVSSIYYVIGFIASVFQLISIFYLVKLFQQANSQLKWNFISKLLLKFSLIAYSLKIGSQILSSFPFFVEKSLALKPFFIIGYLHLFTLAFMSALLLLILNKLEILKLDSFIGKFGIYCFLIGVLITEGILFLKGFFILGGYNVMSNYNAFLLIFSFLILIGILSVFISQFIGLKKD
jgi:hypothetical protein